MSRRGRAEWTRAWLALSLAAPSVAAAQDLKPLEVTITEARPPAAATRLTRSEVREVPGTFGDPFRALELLPGVTPIVSGLPYFYVRGAPPGNLGYFVEGVRVPYLFHLLGGPSVVHPAMLDRVELYPGGYPAEFGRYSGGIVTAETTAPRTDFHGEASLRLFDAGALAETGFSDGRGTLLLGGRYSYTAALLSVLQPDITLDYRDAEARVTYDLGRHDRLTLFGFGAFDYLRVAEGGGGEGSTDFIGTEFYRLDVRWDHELPRGGQVQQAVTFGYDRSSARTAGDFRDWVFATRSRATRRLGDRVTWRFGADASLDRYSRREASLRDPDAPVSDEQETWFRSSHDQLGSGIWTDLVLEPAERWQVIPGLRADLFVRGGTGAVGVDPRLATRWHVSKPVTLVHTVGLAHQPPSMIAPIPGMELATLDGGLQTSWQNSLGVEVELPAGLWSSATAYYNRFYGMFDMLKALREDSPTVGGARTEGQAYGLELLLRRRLTKRLGGFLSYTLARSEQFTFNRWTPSQFDRTHVLNAALAFDLGRQWRCGTRFVYYTGVPRYPNSEGVTLIGLTAAPPREPSHWRVDARLEKRWNYGEGRWLSFVADWLNASLTKESVDGTEVGPITLPSLGLEAGW